MVEIWATSRDCRKVVATLRGLRSEWMSETSLQSSSFNLGNLNLKIVRIIHWIIYFFFLSTSPGFVFSVQKFIHAISVLQKTIGHFIKRTPSDWGSLKHKNLFFKTKWIEVKKTFVSIKGSRCFIVRLSRKSSRSTSDLRNLRTIFLSFSITSSTSNVCRPDRTDLNYDLLTFSWKFTYQL